MPIYYSTDLMENLFDELVWKFSLILVNMNRIVRKYPKTNVFSKSNEKYLGHKQNFNALGFDAAGTLFLSF